jgi:hypothetical protein
MKKNYIYPNIKISILNMKTFICTPTGVNGGGSGSDIGYGGTDDEGEIDPSVKERDNCLFEYDMCLSSDSNEFKNSLW